MKALIDREGDEDTRIEGALLLVDMARNMHFLRSLLVEVKGGDKR